LRIAKRGKRELAKVSEEAWKTLKDVLVRWRKSLDLGTEVNFKKQKR